LCLGHPFRCIYRLACVPRGKAQNLVLYSSACRRNMCVLSSTSSPHSFSLSEYVILRSSLTVEVIGYAARGISHGQAPNPTIAPYVISTLLLLVAPALFAASIYMILGRIILSVDAEAHSLIKTRWLTKVFVTSDVGSFFIQLAGTLCLNPFPYYPIFISSIQ
jgi:hypothetical protein